MLQKLSEEVAECQRRARDAAERASAAIDPNIKSTYLDLERRWLLLAKSYEFTQRVADFNAESKRRVATFRPPMPPHPALPMVTCSSCGRTMRLARIEPLIDNSQQMTFECICGATLNRTAR
jgi:hypothetical protein